MTPRVIMEVGLKWFGYDSYWSGGVWDPCDYDVYKVICRSHNDGAEDYEEDGKRSRLWETVEKEILWTMKVK